MDIQVLYEDNHLLIINKPFGELVHFDRTGDTPIEAYLKAYIKNKYNKPGSVFLRAAHRLDRPVSGVLVYVRTSKALERMARLFKERKISKTYWALTHKMPRQMEGRVDHYLYKNRQKNLVEVTKPGKDGAKRCQTDFRVVADLGERFLVELKPITGRSHQLRVALRSLGSPILGDMKYGGKKISNPRSILLHARSIGFIHPVSQKEVLVEAPLPALPEWQGVDASYLSFDSRSCFGCFGVGHWL